MKKQLNEIKRMQQLAGVIKESQFNGGITSYTQWKPALVSFIQSNLTDDIGDLDILNDVLREIIADNEQELADPNNQDYLSENLGMNSTQLNKPALGILWRKATPEDGVSSKYVWMEDNVRDILTRLYKSLGEEDDDAIQEVIDSLFYEMSPVDQGITSTVGEILQAFKEEYERFGL